MYSKHLDHSLGIKRVKTSIRCYQKMKVFKKNRPLACEPQLNYPRKIGHGPGNPQLNYPRKIVYGAVSLSSFLSVKIHDFVVTEVKF